MKELTNTAKRVRRKLKSLNDADDIISDIETEYRKGRNTSQDGQIQVSTTPGLGEIRVTAHWFTDYEPSEELREILYSDLWDDSALYRNGGHSKSKPNEYEYHIVAKKSITVS